MSWFARILWRGLLFILVNDLMQQPLFVCSIFLLTLYLSIVGFQDVRLFKPYAAKQEWNTTAHV